MKHKFRLAAAALTIIAAGSQSFAVAPKTYQVTGAVTAIDDTSYTVKKGSEIWVIQKDVATPATPELKVGDKVTVNYKMVATKIDDKSAKK